MKKGRVHINTNGDYLCLRFTYQGERYSLSLGAKDTKTNRRQAQETILQIEADIESDSLDASLDSYRPKRLAQQNMTCLELYQKWLEFKSKFVDKRTIEWYRFTETKLEDLESTSAKNLSYTQAIQLLSKLQSENLSPQTIRRQIENLRACWNWGIKRRWVKPPNPWEELVHLIRVPQPTQPEPFTKAEVAIILDKFMDLYPELYPFVKFLFSTGCRTGEARGLLWNNLDKFCSKCEINGQLSRHGDRKPTKTGKTRVLHLPQSIQQMLMEMRSQIKGDGYVFLLNAHPIREDEFRHRWERVLRLSGIKHRKPYITRATFISHALAQGIDPTSLAKQTGHSVRVLLDHYAGSIEKNPKLPDIF